jgi:hypothetical protein
MTRRNRLRRTAILSLHCLRNLAFYKAAHEVPQVWAGEQFWITVHNDFLDIGVLEWCKIFGDKKAIHYWRQSVFDHNAFYGCLLDHLRLTDDLFYSYTKEMRTYRDKFLAHLDEDERMNIPNLAPAIKSVQFLYQHLLDVEDDCDAFPDAPPNAVEYFRGFMAEARTIYARKVER